MDERVFQGRTKAIALRTIRLVNTLPSSGAAGGDWEAVIEIGDFSWGLVDSPHSPPPAPAHTSVPHSSPSPKAVPLTNRSPPRFYCPPFLLVP